MSEQRVFLLRLSCVALVSLAFCGGVIAQNDPCQMVIERAAVNLDYRFGTATSSSTQADALCDERYERMSDSQ